MKKDAAKTNRVKKIWFLHGFLGKPQDGDFLQSISDCEAELLNFFQMEKLNPQQSFMQWSQNFCDHVKSQSRENAENILIGYSLGGRLAAHAFAHSPGLFSKLILISSHLGLESPEEKLKRKLGDKAWAEKFLKLPWSELMTQWFSQEVFQGQRDVVRIEDDFDRELLASALTNWSLSMQMNLLSKLIHHQEKISYLYGEKDEKFKNLALLYQLKGLQVVEVPHSSHRVILDQPAWVSDFISGFTSTFSNSKFSKSAAYKR